MKSITTKDGTELPPEILKGLVKKVYPEPGGQQAGMSYGITLSHPDMGFSITINCHKSQVKNFNFAMSVFELYFEEYKK